MMIQEDYQKYISLLDNLQKQAGIGWWCVNFNTKTYTYSDFLHGMLESEARTLCFDEFKNLIHPDHKERVLKKSMLFKERGIYEESFPIKTKHGYRWVHSKLGDKELNEKGEIVAQGFIRFLNDNELEAQESVPAKVIIRELINNYTDISISLFKLLRTSDTNAVINEILVNILDKFNGDRAYIFEIDWGKRTHSCTFEVVKKTITPVESMLKNISLDDTPWWRDKMLNNSPIILNSIEDISDKYEPTYEILKSQDIESLMVMPMISKDNVWGYIGIDIVGKIRSWTNVDKEWFLSLANVISICMELKKSENMAQKEKEYFGSLFNNMPIGFLNIKLLRNKDGEVYDYIYAEANPAVAKISNTPTEQIIGSKGSTFKDIIPIPQIDELYNKTSLGEVISKTSKLGDDKYYMYTIYSVEVDEIIILFRDNTESVLATQAINRNEQTLRNIYENIPVGIEIYDKTGKLIDINNIEQKMFGFNSKEEIIGVDLFKNPALPPEQIEMLRKGESVQFEFEYNFENIKQSGYYRSKNEGKKNIMIKGTALYDHNNNIENYMLIVIDNTESLNAHHKIYEFELLFNSIAEISEIGVCRWNPLINNFMGSDQWFANLCHENKSIGNLTEAYTNVHPDDKKRIEVLFEDMMKNKIDHFREEVRVKVNDEWKWLRGNYKLSEYVPEKNNIQIVGMNIDITELKNTELKLIEAKTKAEESDRLKSAFLANMSHEIRTPLNAIVGFSDLLVDTEDLNDREQYMSIIRQNNELLLQLISDILDLSKIESGIIDTTMGIIDVNTMCDEIVKSYAMKVPGNLELKFTDRIDECFLNSDRNRLTQVISNFINNSLKFTHSGGITLSYKISEDDIIFFVEDSGVGIDSKLLPTIFDRFVKLNSFVPGTGLGLSICKSLTLKLGGKIGANSKIGKGSCFWFSLPYNKPESSKTTLPQTNMDCKCKTPIKSSREKPTLLIAEDTDSNYLLVSTILAKDYNLVHAHNGLEAVEFHKITYPDLILMDMRMPKMTGLEAIKAIREIDKNTPIIALTAFAFDSDRESAINAGCCDFITKPISSSTLREAIKKHLHH